MKHVGHEARPAHGYPDRVLAAAERRLGFALPVTLRETYRLVGKHPVHTKGHNRLVSPSALQMIDGLLVFQREVQAVCSHGVLERDLDSPDPPVQQRSRTGKFVNPYSPHLSTFLMESTVWEALLRHGRVNGPFHTTTDHATLARMIDAMKVVVDREPPKGTVTAMHGLGVVACAFTKAGSPEVAVYVGSASGSALDRFLQRFRLSGDRWRSARV